MKSCINTPRVRELLDALYADAAQNDPLVRDIARQAGEFSRTGGSFLGEMRKAYSAVPPEFGRLLYALARATRARTVVEFGTSFGVSTIHLAAAIRDNGGGRVITTEFAPDKAERAKKNLTDAGLADLVEFRVGDALQTLAGPVGEIDMVFLDGAKNLYFDVLKLLEPGLRSGAIVASDNTDHDGVEAFLDYIRNPANGYTTSAIFTAKHEHRHGHEITVRN
ncbi:O-methyltransferase [Opitutaceae bacterium TAV5]|nr:O-methyltransferase [Opitutaceae bacterium TAV5]